MKKNLLNFLLLILIINTNLLSANHFSPVWSGNPYQPMSIFISSAKINDIDMVNGDEIGIFDINNKGQEVCVGSGILAEIISPENELLITASMNDPATPEMDGFINGNDIIYKLWDANEEIEVNNVSSSYHSGFEDVFTPLGTAITDLLGITSEPKATLPDRIIGHDFTIPLNIKNLFELDSMSIEFEFNDTLLSASNATLENGILGYWTYNLIFNTNPGITYLDFFANDSLFTGSGDVAFIDFVFNNPLLVDSTNLVFTKFIVNGEDYINNVINGSVKYEISIDDEIFSNKQCILSNNYPNPFSLNTVFSYSIPNNSFVKIQIFNIKGQLIKTLVNDYKTAGTYELSFILENIKSGIYLYKLFNHNEILQKKMILMK